MTSDTSHTSIMVKTNSSSCFFYIVGSHIALLQRLLLYDSVYQSRFSSSHFCFSSYYFIEVKVIDAVLCFCCFYFLQKLIVLLSSANPIMHHDHVYTADLFLCVSDEFFIRSDVRTALWSSNFSNDFEYNTPFFFILNCVIAFFNYLVMKNLEFE